jgi:hypothetical protein
MTERELDKPQQVSHGFLEYRAAQRFAVGSLAAKNRLPGEGLLHARVIGNALPHLALDLIAALPGCKLGPVIAAAR